MSETQTTEQNAPKQDEGVKVAEEVLTKIRTSLVKVASRVRAKGRELTLARIAMGKTANASVVTLTSAGLSAAEAQDVILGMLRDEGFEGYDNWSTVASWGRAAVVADSFTPEVREAVLAEGGLSIDGLQKVGTIPQDEREQFVHDLMTDGKVSDGKVREAVREHKSANAGDGKRKSAGPSGADALVTKLSKVADEVRGMYPEGSWTPELQEAVTAACLMGVRIARDAKTPTKAQTLAAETLSYFGPVADEDGAEDEESK